MLKLITAAVALALLAPATAAAHDAGSISHKNRYLRAKVIHLHGERAPGRDIVRQGLRGGKQASHRQIHRYFEAMRRMVMPAPAARFVQATRPYQPPAQTATARATSAPLSAIRQCESEGSGGYSANTGNGFYGAYQFTQSTWNSVGGTGNPAAASPAEQDKRAAILYAQQGASPWPVCGR